MEKIGLEAVFETDKFDSGVKKYGRGVDQVEGTNKKASGSFNLLKGGLLNIQAGLQIAETAFHAVNEVLDETIGKAVGYNKSMLDMAASTGMGVEDLSRIVQVADDYGISMGEVQKALEMATKNGFQPSIDSLAALADEFASNESATDRAARMTKIFGKNWAALAPMLADGGDALRRNAEAVQNGLVVTADAAAASEEYRLAMDQLNDAVEAVKINIGNGLIPVLTQLLNSSGPIRDEYRVQADEIFKTSESYDDYIDRLKETARQYGMLIDKSGNLIQRGGGVVQSNFLMSESMYSAGKAAEEVNFDNFARQLNTMAIDAGTVAQNLGGIKMAIGELTVAEIGRQAIQDLNQALDDGKISQDEYDSAFGIIATQMLDLPASQVVASKALGLLRQDFQDGKVEVQEFTTNTLLLGDTIKTLPEEKNIVISVDFDLPDNFDEVMSLIDNPNLGGTAGAGGSGGGGGGVGFAKGGHYTAGEVAVVGDGGRPEVFVADKPGYIYPSIPDYLSSPAGQSMSAGVTNVTYNYNLSVETEQSAGDVAADFALMRLLA